MILVDIHNQFDTRISSEIERAFLDAEMSVFFQKMSLQNIVLMGRVREVSNMDVDEYRNMINEFSGLPLFDEKCSFYYDETGNVRKFRLTENGVNAEEGIANDSFLGGVLF